MNTWIVTYLPGPQSPTTRELTVRAPNMPQAFEVADSKLKLVFPNYKLQNVRQVGQAQLPLPLEEAVESWRDRA